MEDRVLHIFTQKMNEILIEQRFCFYLVGMLSRATRRLERMTSSQSLSPHTINAYLQSSVRKLDWTKALAKACRLGLI